MVDIKTDDGKLHLILELIDRRDIRNELNEQFSKEAQREIFQLFKGILADEITFVMNLMKEN